MHAPASTINDVEIIAVGEMNANVPRVGMASHLPLLLLQAPLPRSLAIAPVPAEVWTRDLEDPTSNRAGDKTRIDEALFVSTRKWLILFVQ